MHSPATGQPRTYLSCTMVKAVLTTRARAHLPTLPAFAPTSRPSGTLPVVSNSPVPYVPHPLASTGYADQQPEAVEQALAFGQQICAGGAAAAPSASGVPASASSVLSGASQSASSAIAGASAAASGAEASVISAAQSASSAAAAAGSAISSAAASAGSAVSSEVAS